MSFDAGHAKAYLDLDTTSYNEGFHEAHTHAAEEGSGIREICESIGEVLTEVVGPAAGAAGEALQSAFAGFSEGPAIGTLNVLGLIAGKLREAIVDVGGSFHDLGVQADRAGVGVEFLSGLSAVAKTVNLPLEQLSHSFSILQKTAEEALGPGGEKLAGAFQKIGIGAEQLKDLSADPEALFTAIQHGLGDVGNQSERTRIALELLGRGGAELLPIFKMTSEQFDSVREKLEHLSGGVNQHDVEIGNSFNMLEAEVSAAWEGIQKKLAEPALDWISEHQAEIEAGIEKVADTISDDLVWAWDYLKKHQNELVADGQAVIDFFNNIAPIIEAAAGEAEDMAKAVAGIAKGVSELRDHPVKAVGDINSAVQRNLVRHDSLDLDDPNGPFAKAMGLKPTGGGNVTYNVNVAAPDPRESAAQFAARVKPQIERIQHSQAAQLAGASMQRLAERSMGG